VDCFGNETLRQGDRVADIPSTRLVFTLNNVRCAICLIAQLTDLHIKKQGKIAYQKSIPLQCLKNAVASY